jgi:hypothetical protein
LQTQRRSPVRDDPHDLRHDDPEGGHDPDALEEGARRMRATKAGEETERDPDPAGGHDREALDEAADRMGVDKR